MNKIKISFIIPAYNINDYIEKCVYSIINQNNSIYDKEIVIVNDGSTDGIEKKLIKLEEKYNFIKIITKKNGGLSSARNEGLKIATGDYIWFIDGDDYIEPDSLQILKKYIINNKYDIIYFNYYKDYQTKKIKMIETDDYKKGKSKILINTSPCTKIFNRKFLLDNNVHFDEGIIYEDLALVPYLISKSNKDLFINDFLYNYVYRKNSIMNSNKIFKKNRDDKFKSIENLIERFKTDNNYNKYFEQLEFIIIKHLLIVYSSEILIYKRKIYLNRCKKILKQLDALNINWFKNTYVNKMSYFKKLYVYLFKKRMFLICKIIMIILRKVGRL